MKHIAPIESADETPVKKLTRRTLAKQQTRAKVLEAARRLFSEQGYDGATIRDIAAEAGMSTGAVFANFADKSDLFREIVLSDVEALIVAQRAAGQAGKTVEDAVLGFFMAGYAYFKTQLPLARAAFGISWTLDEGHALRTAAPVVVQMSLITDLLQAAVERGELSQDAEVALRSQMLYDTYLSNFAQAIFEGWSLEALESRSRDQIRILLAGARQG